MYPYLSIVLTIITPISVCTIPGCHQEHISKLGELGYDFKKQLRQANEWLKVKEALECYKLVS